MKHTRQLAIAVFATLALTACKKDDDSNPSNGGSNSTVEDKLTNKSTRKWVSTDFRINGVSIWDFMDACEKDNYVQFSATGKDYEENEGATKCDPANDQIIDEGTWALNAAKDSLFVYYTSQDTMVYKIISITNTSMTMRNEDDGGNISEADLVVKN